MAGPLVGRRALITGSTRGLGQAIAGRLAEDGCYIVLNGLGEPDEIEALRGSLEARFGIHALYHGADLADPEAIAAMMDHVAATFGAADILVNNAVVRHVAPVDAF